MYREHEVRKKGTLLLKADGNWDYYLYNNTVYSIATDEQCDDGYFGDITHIRKLVKNGVLTGMMTSTGNELLK